MNRTDLEALRQKTHALVQEILCQDVEDLSPLAEAEVLRAVAQLNTAAATLGVAVLHETRSTAERQTYGYGRIL